MDNKTTSISFLTKGLVLLVFLSFSFIASATHIVGGSLTYVHNGGSSYTVTLKLYRDCGPGTAGLPGNVNIAVRGNNGATFNPSKDFTMNRISITPVPSTLDPCAVAPNPMPCVQEGVYTATINDFTPNAGGYHMSYQVIARNLSILNVNNAVCNCIGESFYAYIPGQTSIWFEDFQMNDNITVDNGPTSWSVTNGATAVADAETDNNQFRFRGANNGEATWVSEIVNIAAYPGGVDLSVDLSETGNLENSDLIAVYYRLNGGPLTQFATNGLRTNDFGAVISTQTGLIGTTVQILVEVNYGGNSGNNERYFVDNVSISGGNAVANLSNPEFNLVPPLFLCVNQPFTFDHSATDLDGDSLFYSFYTPYDGDNGAGALDPTFPGNVATFTPIVWNPGYSATNPLGGAPLTLDPNTGLLSGTPPMLGQFVVGIKVTEYRNGVYISETLRDVQFNILNCPQPNPPFAGPDLIINDGCIDTLSATGYLPGTTTWTSVFPGAPGDFDSFLSCTNCIDPSISPTGTPPAFVDYVICGTAASCNNAFICDTVRVEFNPTLFVDITPQNPTLCFGQTSTTLTATGNGGTPPYTYLWNNVNPSQTNIVGAGTFTVMCSDNSGCPPVFSTVTVTAYNNPITANAGLDDTLCIQSPLATLNGTVLGANGGIWTGGNGTYSPSSTTLTGMNYTPTAVELAAGFVDLILTTTGNGDCPSGADTVRISFLDFIGTPSVVPTNVSCYNADDGSALASVAGGIAPFTYIWNTTPIQNIANATGLSPGTYSVVIENGIGCIVEDSAIITEPTPMALNFSSTDNSCFGDSNGEVIVSPIGGTPGYTYLWTTGGQTSDTINGLLSGIYEVTVTDTNGCTITGNDTIVEPLALNVAFTQTNVSCNGGSDGSAISTVTGGVAPYSYSWTPAAGSANNAVGLSAGTYILTITDFNNCTLVDSVIITEPLLPISANATSSNISCFGAADGDITLAPTGGTTPYTFAWLPGLQSSNSISNLDAGTYTYTVSDVNGCSTTDFVTIVEPIVLTLNTSQVNVSCFGENNGVAIANVSGGLPGYSFLWTPGGQTTPSINNLLAGINNVTVSDTNGCQVQSSVVITEPSALNLTLTPTQTSCNAGNDGSLTSTVIGGTTPYTYFWLPGGETTNSISNQTAGNYSLTVTDTNGCIFSDSSTIIEPSILAVTYASTNVSCYGGSDGTTTAIATGGTGPYTYLWHSSGSTSSSALGLSAGTYLLSVTDFNNCSITDSVTITEPLLPVSTISTVNDVTCFGGNNGSANTVPSGGTAPYLYLWSPGGETVSTINGQVAGTYIVTVVDDNGCIVTDTAIINEPTLSTITFDSQVNVSCFGGSDGAISASGSGGTPNYTYLWSPGGETTSSITGLSAGVYTLILTDNNGCSVQNTTTVTEPTVTAVFLSATNVSCFGGNDGTVSAVPSGGTGLYTYLWMPGGQTTSSLSGQTVGTYTVTVTDDNGCTATDNITITEPSEIVLSSGSVNSACGLANGLAYVSVASGGTGPFSYLWSPVGGVNDTATGLFAGSYNVVVTDANGCTAQATGNVNDNASATPSIGGTTNVSCPGGNDGTATVNLVGGIGPFTYAWSPLGGTAATATGLSTGVYTVVVTGSNGCESTITTPVITEPSPIVTVVTETDVNCFGGNDGGASAISVGGTAGYNYQWLPGGTIGNSVINLAAGIDSVITTDANGCTKTTLFTIQEPATPVSIALSTTPVTCFGGNDGTASVVASGGSGPYSYNWMPGNISGVTASALSAGTYTVTVTDVKGCSIVDSITVVEPTEILLTTATVNSTCGLTNGEASVAVVGGVGPYSFSWSPLGGNNATANNLLAGNYTVFVIDNNGCVQQAPVVINDTPGPTATITSTTNISCSGGADGTATVTPVGGTLPYTYLWSPIGGTAATGTGFTTGLYTVKVTDSNGCIFNATTPVITEPSLLLTIVTENEVSCFGGNDGGASAVSVGGTAGYTYQWLPSGTFGNSVINLSAGVDSVITTDINGCTDTTLFTITEPAVLTATISSKTDVSCFGGSNGEATVAVSGGTMFYSYNWVPYGGNGATAIGLAAGTYTVIVTDINGCFTTVSVTIDEPVLTLSATATVVEASCFGASNGSATINPVGGTPGYSYLWAPFGGTGQSATGLSSGNYTVTVLDTNSCQANISLIIAEPPALVGVLDTINPSCELFNGAISTMITGGTAPYSYLWAPGAEITPAITNLAPNTYSVDVTDDMGCVLSLSANLENITGPSVSIPTVTNVTCFGGNDGSATALIVGGSTPYDASWLSYGGNTITANSLIEGKYYVNVTDSLGCTAIDSVIITEPIPISITLSSSTDVSCNGGNDGAISIVASGGAGNYTYSWAPNTSNLDNVNGLSAGTYTVTVTDNNGCSEVMSVIIEEPQQTLTSTITSIIPPNCFSSLDGSVTSTVTGGTAPYTYLWSNGQTGSTATNLGGGTFGLIVTDFNGCTTTDNTVVTPPGQVLTVAGPDVVICLGSSDDVTASAVGGIGVYSYSWQPTGVTNAGVLNVTPIVDTEYTVMAFDQNGCPGDLDTISAKVLSLDASNINAMITVPVVCVGQSTEVSVEQIGINDPLSFVWDNGVGIGPGPFTVFPTQTTTYTVTATNACGISETSSVTVNISPPPTLVFDSDVDSLCLPATIHFTDNSLTGYGPDQIHFWNWNFGDGSSSQVQNPVHTYDEAGVYQVILTVTTGNGCTSNNLITPHYIAVYPNPVASFTVNSDDLFLPNDELITTNTSTGATIFNWNFGDGSTSVEIEPEYFYTSIGDYPVELIVYNDFGCSDTATLIVTTFTDFKIPTAFTPSSGGSSGGYFDVNSLDNDIFFPYTAGVVDYKFEIFNRWGELIFITDDINQGWDGYYKGELVQQGVYVWKLFARLNNEMVFDKTGDVTLLR